MIQTSALDTTHCSAICPDWATEFGICARALQKHPLANRGSAWPQVSPSRQLLMEYVSAVKSRGPKCTRPCLDRYNHAETLSFKGRFGRAVVAGFNQTSTLS